VNYDQLIFDWNTQGAPELPPGRPYLLDDESLRDGLQSPSVRDPSIGEKIEILHLMAALGIDSVNLGLPGAGPRARADVERLAREIVSSKLKIRPNCAARTVEADIQPIAEVSDKVGIAIEAATFLGSSPIRRYAEDWTVDFLLRTTEHAVRYARSLGLPVMYVTEDTTRAQPDVLRRLYTAAIEAGARRICLADTVGHATPEGVRNLIHFIRDVVQDTGEYVKIDWHGHRDRGLAIVNALEAIRAGADRIHGTAVGVGERVGNTPMDLLLLNAWLMNLRDFRQRWDLEKLKTYAETASRAVGLPVPPHWPTFSDVTSSPSHAQL